ncbi:hypothetical protein [Aerosakkonema funiforme]|uniref:hypothetical protein n=1 Tax=Aerosakkonema funiforme TaxID=1246630 RepID=UPI0035BB367D
MSNKKCDRPSFYFRLTQGNPTSFSTHNLIHFYDDNVMIRQRAIAYGTLRDRSSFYFRLTQGKPTSFYTHNLIHFYDDNARIEQRAIGLPKKERSPISTYLKTSKG